MFRRPGTSSACPPSKLRPPTAKARVFNLQTVGYDDRIMSYGIRLTLLTFLLTLASFAAEAGVLDLAIGDPERRDQKVPLELDAITDTHTGELITPAELPARLIDADLLLIGESHTNMDSHRVQHRVIEELDRAGRKVMIGLEMFPYTHQKHLDRWVAGHYSEEGFLELADWYSIWGYHWNYYRDLFLLARERGIPMFGVNTPREVVTAVREKGFEDLTEEEAAHIPNNIDTDSEEHLQLFKSYFSEDDPIHAQMSDEAWQSMLDAQSTWDATMGYNAVKAFEATTGEDDGAIMVVLTGSGHVAYGLGIARQAAQWFEGEIAQLIPVSVVGPDGEPVDQVQASYADFLWGVPEVRAPIYPSLGLSTREDDDGNREVIFVSEGSPAERAGFQLGDILRSVEGVDIRVKGNLSRLMAGKRWGDSLSATVQRGDETLELLVLLRRTIEDDEDDEDDEDEDDDVEEYEDDA